MLTRTVRVRPGARVLVHGAAGGIGTAALEIGRVAGLDLYGTATGAGVDVVRNLGATAIDYRGEDFVRRIRESTGRESTSYSTASGAPSPCGPSGRSPRVASWCSSGITRR
jgi:NADPH:quinone reductase-like Zn-dependent oxidoreductase